jgi:hypothetical protein
MVPADTPESLIKTEKETGAQCSVKWNWRQESAAIGVDKIHG